jgi:hypothetical protein
VDLEKKRKKVDLIDDFGRDEDHVDETGDELPEKVVGRHELHQVQRPGDPGADQAHVVVTAVV